MYCPLAPLGRVPPEGARDATDVLNELALQTLRSSPGQHQCDDVDEPPESRLDLVRDPVIGPDCRKELQNFIGDLPRHLGPLSLDGKPVKLGGQVLQTVQLEHAAAIENVDEILEVDGVDVFFIGPSDLSQSMGHPGNPGAEPVKSAIEDTLRKITAAGKTPGMPAALNNIDTVLGAGVKYIYNHLPKLVGAGAAGFLDKARG